MKVTSLICDKCGKKVETPIDFYINVVICRSVWSNPPYTKAIEVCEDCLLAINAAFSVFRNVLETIPHGN